MSIRCSRLTFEPNTVAERWEGVTNYRQYLSQFYAFLPYPPFKVVAISGHFCLSHMNENDIGYSKQWNSLRPIDKTALIQNETYRCPIVAFANGLKEKIWW